MAGRVLLWRWRRNALKRGTDRVEAWLVLVFGLLLAVGGASVGYSTYQAVEDEFAEQRQERHRTHAVLLRATPEQRPAHEESIDGRVAAPLRWTDRNGVEHTATVRVELGRKAGASVDIWTDRSGAVAERPPTAEEAAFQAALLATLAALCAGAAVLVVLHLLRRELDRLRLELWERAWREIGPLWSSGQI